MKTLSFPRPDASLGLQNASSWILRKQNELEDGRNIRFNEQLGTYQRRNGYVTDGDKFSVTGKLPCGSHTANFTTGAKRFVAVNNDTDTFCIVRSQNSDGTWTTIISDIPADSDVYFKTYRDEVYVSGFVKATGTPFAPYNIDKTLDVSQTRNLLNTPFAAYFETYRGLLYAANVLVSGSLRHPDRFYKSSAPTGAFTFVQGAQTDVAAPQTMINNVPTMTSTTAPTGATGASTSIAGEESYRAFDGNFGTIWTSTAPTGTLQYDFGVSVAPIITYYSITGGRSGVLTRAPKTWIFQGSNNGSTWTNIDTRTNVPAFATAEQRTYPVTNTTAYRYYRLNISANQGDATYLDVIEFGMYTSLSAGVKPFQLQLDSVRYAKAGMYLDIYKSGTTTLLYTVLVYSVDKPNNIIQFLPLNWAISAVDTTANTLTIPTTASIPTGTPINFSATTGLPAPLSTGVQYYAINVNATTIKVATSLANATIGQAIDITTAGSGTNTTNLSYVVNNNDEVYLAGTYGKLSTLWNTDYPTADSADWSAVQSGVDAANVITGVLESNNRLFVFTLNSGSKFDGNTTIPFNSTVGCANQRVLKNIDDDWLVWLSARGRVYARSEASGQQQYISRGITNKLLKLIPTTQLITDAAAGITDNEYVLYVGNFEGEPTRIVYDFGSNTHAIDAVHHPTMMYSNNVPADGKPDAGFIKPYFVSSDGYLYQDNFGWVDGVDTNPIRLMAHYGKVNYGSENIKKFIGCFIYAQQAQGLKVLASVDDSSLKTIGELSEKGGTMITYPVLGSEVLAEGSTIDITINGAINGPPQIIESFIDYYGFIDTLVGYGQTA